MKIHNPTDLDLEPGELRALARGELDPIKKAIEEHRSRNLPATSIAPPDKGRKPAERKRAETAENKATENKTTESKVPAKARQTVPANATGKQLDNTRGRTNKAADAAKRNSPAGGKEAAPKQTAEQRKEELLKLKEQQARLVQIIRECEPLEVLNYDLLAMKQYPDVVEVLGAKRRRDLWLLAILLSAGMFLIGWFGFLPAWLAGVSFGVLVALLSFSVPPVRRLFVKVPNHGEIVATKKAMEFRAISHIRMLEGSRGLAYQCQMMIPYRRALADKRYKRIVLLSQQSALIKAMRSAAAIRLYLMYMLEAQQAFKVVKNDYMKISSRLQSEFSDVS
ncbi:hypothetical protein BTA51_10710 [Hahella sp. CCB-MM4]|uniref:hypothetical protein n=1 Tax=Hahella sp. (strain CCB-MM4) TaxID=1926491 RepID=UPI000B9B2D8B|nr:hypothetical protein [Hahella sp. CCB-MM4]OZG73480.1 hypothetical protein BTA51_10710 [Hahella sp. CCB-MM4]